MATAAPTGDEDLIESRDTDDSLTKMSEEANEMYCEHCEKEMGTNVTATGFCVDCVEYLCPTCIRYHKKYIPEHTQQDSSHMPQDFCYDKCPLHPREIIKFYCEACEDAVCKQCKLEKHKDCSSVCHIPSKVQTTGLKDELKQVTQLIDETLEGLTVKQEKVNSDLTEVHSSRKKATAAIGKRKETLKGQVQDQHKQLLDELERKQEHLLKENDWKRTKSIAKLDQERAEIHYKKIQRIEQLRKQQQQMLEQIDKAEQDLDEKSDQINKTDAYKVQLVISSTNKMENEVKEIKRSIEEKNKAGEKCRLFVALKTAKQSLKYLKTDIENVDDDTDVSFYEFQAYIDNIYKISFFQYIRFGASEKTLLRDISFGKLLEKSGLRRTINRVCTINVKSDTDKTKSNVTGICKYSDFLVAADNNNKTIKLINTKQQGSLSTSQQDRLSTSQQDRLSTSQQDRLSTSQQDRLTASLQLQEKPFDVTCVEGDEVAVTLPKSGKIQFLSITEQGELSMASEIGVGKSCHGIEYKKPNLIVAFLNPPKVQILSTTGVLIRKFSHFSGPTYIHVGHSGKIFYIQDTKPPCVKKVTYDGHIITESSTIQGVDISGLAVDHFGSVFIAVREALSLLCKPRLIQFSSNFKVTEEVGMGEYTDECMSCLFYCSKEHKLYAATDAGNILVFKLT